MTMSQVVSEERIDVLNVGSGMGNSPRVYFPKAKIVNLDIDPLVNPDVVWDISLEFPGELCGQFDLVYCSHTLEHIRREDVLKTLQNIMASLRPGGEMWVIVPSLEWAANQALSDFPSPALQIMLYGDQQNAHQYHKSGFTLYLLRALMERAGLVIRHAYQTDFTINMDEKEYAAKQNIVIGLKYVAPD